MDTVGIICEYNPFHLGHSRHIEKTKEILGGDVCTVCVMSGNFVQRGDFAIFNKHARAKMAVLGGADVVIELPVPFALGSAREFAKSAVFLLDALGVCDFISFGSEHGDIEALKNAARLIISDKAQEHIREGLGMGLPYARAQQLAADAVLGELSYVFKSPNNTLGIEYIKAIEEINSVMRPITVKRAGGEHDSDVGCSASALRKVFASGSVPLENMPGASFAVCMEEIIAGRGPILMKNMEQAILARLRATPDFAEVPSASDGLDRRFSRIAPIAPTVSAVLEGVKTKRFAMSRIRRVMMCAVLGITNNDVKEPPPYIRVLAMNERGREVLKNAANRANAAKNVLENVANAANRAENTANAAENVSKHATKKATLPIITKPASVSGHGRRAVRLFELECRATDFYALGYSKAEERTGGGDWRRSPVVIK